PMEGELRAFAEKHRGRVHIETTARHDEVPGWLNAMTILCAPSQASPRWREQFGRMLIEAMACGVPILASDTGEIPHVIGAAGAFGADFNSTARCGPMCQARRRANGSA